VPLPRNQRPNGSRLSCGATSPASARVVNDRPRPPGRQHSASFKAIIARQLQALVRRPPLLWRDKRTLCRNILPAATSLEVNANVAGPSGKRPTTVGAGPLLLARNDRCSRVEHLDLLVADHESRPPYDAGPRILHVLLLGAVHAIRADVYEVIRKDRRELRGVPTKVGSAPLRFQSQDYLGERILRRPLDREAQQREQQHDVHSAWAPNGPRVSCGAQRQ
jgi:hypothetical protein